MFEGPEYGTTEAAWKSILTESERVSDLHLNMKEQLCNDVMQQIRVWQKDNYHKVRLKLFSMKNEDKINTFRIFLIGNDAN